MFKLAAKAILSKYLKSTFVKKNITEEDLKPIIREIRIALLNSDVNLKVIKLFLDDIKEEVLQKKFFSGDEKLDVLVFQVIKKKLINILGSKNKELHTSGKINRYLIVGLNGSGKTTSTAKLSYWLKNKNNGLVQNISLDIYRPGAFDQLKQLSDSVGIECFHVKDGNFKKTINDSLVEADSKNVKYLLFDSYGLLFDNEKLLEEISYIKKNINPTEVLFVVDAMSGQEILDAISVFHSRLNITGLIISKTDSNAPMGAAFSASYLLNIPIKFLGEGENIKDLVPFYPDRIASLILGEGDILSLADKVKSNADLSVSKKIFFKMMRGNFDLEDLIKQIREIRKIGSFQNIFKFLPGNFSSKIDSFGDVESQLNIWEVIINSMTLKERRNPKLFKKQPNRKVRVVKGSGRKPDELNKLLKK